MHGICFDFPLQEWFGFDIPQTTISPKFIETALQSDQIKETSANTKVIWLGGPCSTHEYYRTKKENHPYVLIDLTQQSTGDNHRAERHPGEMAK